MINFKYLNDVIDKDLKRKTDRHLFVVYFESIKNLFRYWEVDEDGKPTDAAKKLIEQYDVPPKDLINQYFGKINESLGTKYEFDDFVEE